MPRRLYFKEFNNFGNSFPGYTTIGVNTTGKAVKTDEFGITRPIESVYTDETNTIVVGSPGGTGSVSINGVYTLPNTDGSNGQVLSTDGDGNLTWIASGSNVQNVSYNELKSLVDSNSLSIGKQYRITNFRTRHQIFSSGEAGNSGTTYGVNLGEVEPLLVTALSTNELSKIAYSELYPQDIIHYDLVDPFWSTTTEAKSGGDRGVITYRKDTKKNIEMYQDWRNMRTRRYATQRVTVSDASSFIIGEKVNDTGGPQALIFDIQGNDIYLTDITGVLTLNPLLDTLTGAESGHQAAVIEKNYYYEPSYGGPGVNIISGSTSFYAQSEESEISYSDLLLPDRWVKIDGNEYQIESFDGAVSNVEEVWNINLSSSYPSYAGTTVSFTQDTSDGSGSGIEVEIGFNEFGELLTFALNDRGNGYIEGETVTTNDSGSGSIEFSVMTSFLFKYTLKTPALTTAVDFGCQPAIYNNLFNNGTVGLNLPTIVNGLSVDVEVGPFYLNVEVEPDKTVNASAPHIHCNTFHKLRNSKIGRDSINIRSCAQIYNLEHMGLGFIADFLPADAYVNITVNGNLRGTFFNGFNNNIVNSYAMSDNFFSSCFYNVFNGYVENSILRNCDNNYFGCDILKMIFEGAQNNTFNCESIVSVSNKLLIPGDFNNNKINGSFLSIGTNPSNTIKLNAGFKNNTVNAQIGFLNADFSSATHLYEDYATTVQKSNTGNLKLYYIDDTEGLVVVSATA